jgi:hypothetical protein
MYWNSFSGVKRAGPRPRPLLPKCRRRVAFHIAAWTQFLDQTKTGSPVSVAEQNVQFGMQNRNTSRNASYPIYVFSSI